MNALMKQKLFYRWGLSLLLSLGGLQACSAEVDSATQNWPTECVGHMQFQLPGPADTAATFNSEVQNFKLSARLVLPTFPDGTPAPFAATYIISHPLTEAERKRLIGFAKAEGSEISETTSYGKKIYRLSRGFKEFMLPDSKGIVRRYEDEILATIFVGNSLLKFGVGLEYGERLLKARPRPIFEVPKEPGLCLPYIFVPDDGKAQRGLSMSYRLKDHPDIQITLTDSSAYRPQDSYQNMGEAEIKHRNKGAEPDPEIADFWGQWLTMARKYESQWLVPDTTRPVTMAGYEGRQSFVLLTLDDGTKSYGYYAVVRGKPDATEDTPDLRLYVQQDVKQAQGKTPLTKEHFIEMAQAIARSVQRRPVSQN